MRVPLADTAVWDYLHRSVGLPTPPMPPGQAFDPLTKAAIEERAADLIARRILGEEVAPWEASWLGKWTVEAPAEQP